MKNVTITAVWEPYVPSADYPVKHALFVREADTGQCWYEFVQESAQRDIPQFKCILSAQGALCSETTQDITEIFPNNHRLFMFDGEFKPEPGFGYLFDGKELVKVEGEVTQAMMVTDKELTRRADAAYQAYVEGKIDEATWEGYLDALGQVLYLNPTYPTAPEGVK